MDRFVRSLVDDSRGVAKFVDFWVACAVLCQVSHSQDINGLNSFDDSSDEKLNVFAEFCVDVGLLARDLDQVAFVS